MREQYPHGTNDPHAERTRASGQRVTFGEVLDPVMLPIAFGIAIVALLVLIWHVGRRYPIAPKRVPMRVNIDGRPGRLGPKALLWLAPAAVAIVLGTLGIALAANPPKPEHRLLLTLVLFTVAEVTWFVGWMTDRQIELARKMTYRIAPSRTLRAFFPILATVVVTIVIAVRP
jgi:hypothetical protein